MRQKIPYRYVYAAPAVLLVGVFALGPLLFMGWYGFRERLPNGAEVFSFSGHNYLRILADPLYLSVFFRTLCMATATAAICMVPAFFTAYAFFRKPGRGNRKIYFLLLPFWVSYIIRTLSWVDILGINGVVNRFLLFSGLARAPLDLLFNTGSVLTGLVHYMLPFMVIILYTAMSGIDRTLLEAAATLGGTEWRSLKEIVLPLCMPAVLSGFSLVFVITAGMLLTPLVLGGPGDEMMANLIFNRMVKNLDWPFGAALSTFLSLVLGFTVFFIQRLRSRWFTFDGGPGGRP